MSDEPLKPGELHKLPDYFEQRPYPRVLINPTFNDRGIRVSRREHLMYSLHEMLGRLRPDLPQLFGKWQYFYESKRGLIDLITQPAGLFGESFPERFEICSNGKLFEGPEVYFSREDAEKRIMELLATK
jgi:hypothetical protein